MNRLLSDEFMEDLKTGFLSILLEYVRNDDTLMLAIRKRYINIYYRGGNILKLTEKSKHVYEAFFDANYASKNIKNINRLPVLPVHIFSSEQIVQWVDTFPTLKQHMDFYFSKKSKMEREFQQLVVRENNYSRVSNETEYFIVDIEIEDSDIGARFDLVAIKWPAQNRKAGEVHLALIEMKYGDKALCGKSGIAEHLQQLQIFLANPQKCKELCETAEGQANQLNQLGLLLHKKGDEREFVVNESFVEVIFLFANHNPRTSTLRDELHSVTPVLKSAEAEKLFTPRFFIASSAGYAMHDACMVDIDEYQNFLSK